MDDNVNLLDSEIVAVGQIWKDIQRKYGHRSDTHDNLVSMAKEAEDRFAGIGLDVLVDIISPQPSIQIIGRKNPTLQFDHERKAWEVQRGVADPILESGEITE